MNNLVCRREFLATAISMTLTLVLVLCTVRSILAQGYPVAPVGTVSTPLSQANGPTDPAEMEAFLDELFGSQMEAHQIPGAAVSVVKDGELFFAKGYGYADSENAVPVDPEQTLFRIGSVGKLITWTAVMQLAEQGKLDLDADINGYLDFRIPDTYPQPITLKHLMTHTAGFEDSWFEVFAWDADDLMPVGEWLAGHIPARVRPPGELAAYSNYGANLAGYIVARVSGQSYEQYIQEHLLKPLGMVHTTAQVPVPPNLRPHASPGYWIVDDVLEPVPDYPTYFGQPAMAPSGAHSSTTTDMAQFMIAHLGNGLSRDADTTDGRILSEGAMQQMHSTLYTPDPRILGTAYGFFDFSDNGQRSIGHSGGTLGFSSLLLLLPDQNLGVFVAYNSEIGALTTQHSGFQRAFFDHYYPAPAVEPIQTTADFAQRAGRFVGAYRITQSAYTSLEKIGNLMNPVEIRDLGDGGLLLTLQGLQMRLVEVEPLYFRQADGPLGLVFREDDRGRITHMFADLSPQYAFEKLSWYETPRFNMALALGSIVVFLITIPIVSIIAIRNRRRDPDRKPAARGARMATWTLLGISVLNLLFVFGVVQMLSGLGFPRFGVPLIYRIVLGLGVLSAGLTAGALVFMVLAWKNNYWDIATRLYFTLATAAAVAFVWFLNDWNLLGWRF